MELRSHAKRRRSKELAAGEPPLWIAEAMGAGNPGPSAHSKVPPPPDAGGGGGDDVDRISGLPDAVLGEILSLLSAKEAGRTQILSSRWRHVWLASPLVIDGADLYKIPNLLFGGSSDNEEEVLTIAFEALAGVVTHVLSAHAGPVRRFCIPSICLHNGAATVDADAATVDAWLSCPAFDNLQELEFWTGFWERSDRYGTGPYVFPPPPASTFRFSATLQVATLGKCELPDSSVEGISLPLLKQLGLESVSISEGSLHTMISSCPVLECLLFNGNIGVGCLRISSNSLRSIGVRADVSRFRVNLQLLQEVILVDAPCLERFLYLDAPAYFYKAIDLIVISAPKLETIGCLKEGPPHRPRLVFGTTAIQGLNVVSLTTALSTVKTLAVASEFISLDRIIKLMKCFPCLEKLYIKSSMSRIKNRWHRVHKDFIKSFDTRLKKIMLEQYRGIESQVNFASFFLLNARELESIRLDVGPNDYNEHFFTKHYEMLQMEKRASRGARLHFTTNTCNRHVHVKHVHDLSIADPFECRC